MRYSIAIAGICALVLFFFSAVDYKSATSDDENTSLLTFLEDSTEDNIAWLNGITVHSIVKQVNNFKTSKKLQNLSKNHPISYTIFDLKEEISLEGFVRREGTSLTKYAASASPENLSNSDNSFTQTEQWIQIHTPALLVRLADPNAIRKRNYPQWVVEKNTFSNPLLYDTRSAVYWLAAPFQRKQSLSTVVRNVQSSDLKTQSEITVSSVNPNIIECEFSFNASMEGYQKANIFKACFFAEEPGKWLEIIYFTPVQAITRYMKCTYDEERIPVRIQIFEFDPQEAYEGDIDLSRMEGECDIYFDITVNEFRKAISFPSGYFDYLTQMEGHHYVSDFITNKFYRVSEPDKIERLDEINKVGEVSTFDK